MRIMKALFLLFLSISLTTFSQDTLHMAADVWPPFSDVNGKKSIALEIVSTAFERMGKSVDVEITAFHNVLEGINSKEYAGGPVLWKTDERAESMNYSLPYFQNQLILIGRKGASVDLQNIPDLKGKKLGLVKDYAYGDSIINSKEIDIHYAENDQKNLEALLSNKIDLMLVDQVLINYLFKYQMNDVSELLEIASHPFIIKTLHLAIRKDYPKSKEIIKEFDKQIDTMIADRSYHKILNLDWIAADLDGDGQKEYILNGQFGGTQKPDKVAYEIFKEKQQKSQANKYFVNGTYYNTWEDVPSSYKKSPKVKPVQNPNDASFKINL